MRTGRSCGKRRGVGLTDFHRFDAGVELAGDRGCGLVRFRASSTNPTIFKPLDGDIFLATSVSWPCLCSSVVKRDEVRRTAPKFIRLSMDQENSIPPLMSTFAPVMKAAPSEAR